MGYGTTITASLPTWGQTQWSGTLSNLIVAITGVLGGYVTPVGMDIAADLDLAGNSMLSAASVGLVPYVDTGFARSLFFANTGSLVTGELYVRDGSNRPVPITYSGSLAPTTGGGFWGNYIASGALAAYSSSNSTFYFTQSGSQYLLGNFNAASPTLTSVTGSNIQLQAVTGTGGVALVVANVTGALSTTQTTNIWSQWLDVSVGIGTAGTSYVPGGTGQQGSVGWTLENGSIDIPVPFVNGDALQSIIITSNGLGIVGTLSSRTVNPAGGLTMGIVAALSSTLVALSMSNGAYTMTGTLPYTPVGNDGLVLTVTNNNTQLASLGTVEVQWLRYLI